MDNKKLKVKDLVSIGVFAVIYFVLMFGVGMMGISHRMKSIENADKIVVLENGKVESQGKHGELLQKSKVYRNLIEKTKMAEEFIY